MGNESEIGLTEILVLWSALEMFGTTHLLINVSEAREVKWQPQTLDARFSERVNSQNQVIWKASVLSHSVENI